MSDILQVSILSLLCIIGGRSVSFIFDFDNGRNCRRNNFLLGYVSGGVFAAMYTWLY